MSSSINPNDLSNFLMAYSKDMQNILTEMTTSPNVPQVQKDISGYIDQMNALKTRVQNYYLQNPSSEAAYQVLESLHSSINTLSQAESDLKTQGVTLAKQDVTSALNTNQAGFQIAFRWATQNVYSSAEAFIHAYANNPNDPNLRSLFLTMMATVCSSNVGLADFLFENTYRPGSSGLSPEDMAGAIGISPSQFDTFYFGGGQGLVWNLTGLLRDEMWHTWPNITPNQVGMISNYISAMKQIIPPS